MKSSNHSSTGHSLPFGYDNNNNQHPVPNPNQPQHRHQVHSNHQQHHHENQHQQLNVHHNGNNNNNANAMLNQLHSHSNSNNKQIIRQQNRDPKPTTTTTTAITNQRFESHLQNNLKYCSSPATPTGTQQQSDKITQNNHHHQRHHCDDVMNRNVDDNDTNGTNDDTRRHRNDCDKAVSMKRKFHGTSSMFRSTSKNCLILPSSSSSSSLFSASSSSWSASLYGSRVRSFLGCLCSASVNLIIFLLTIATIVALLLSAIPQQQHLQQPLQLQQPDLSSLSLSSEVSPDFVTHQYYNRDNRNIVSEPVTDNDPMNNRSPATAQIESLPLKANVNEQELFSNLSTTTLVSRSPLNAGEHRRVKRGVIYLASMIKCITGCNPLLYKDYGCYCGFQGDGVPMDGIDSCCQQHDLCYERAECHQSLVYFTPYKWSCSGHGRAICSEINTPCSYQLCQCDRIFAKCLTRYPCPSEKADCFFPPPAMIFRKGIYGQQNQSPQTPAINRRSGRANYPYKRHG